MTVQGLVRDGVGALQLRGEKLDAKLAGALTGGSLERSIGQASTVTLTVDDPERFLLQRGYLSRREDLLFDELWFRMVHWGKQGDLFTLQFEARPIALLRLHKKPRQMSRSKGTRAQFLKMLVGEEPSIGFWCPELKVRQPIAHATYDASLTRRQRGRGIGYPTLVTARNVPLTPSQVALTNQVLAEAQSLGSDGRSALALMEACIVESDIDNIQHPSTFAPDHLGVLAVDVKLFGHDNAVNVVWSVGQFLRFGFTGKGGAIALAKANPTWSAAQIATTVQGNGSAAPYDAFRVEAQQILGAYGGFDDSPGSDDGGDPTFAKQYSYSRGQPGGPKGEDTWSCGNRLSAQVQWRWFEVAGIIYFISDWDLVRSEQRMVLGERTPGVDSIDWEIDTSAKYPDNVTVQCRAEKWVAPPGTVVGLGQELGPDVAGAWIVSDILRPDITDQATTITLIRPEQPKKEPATQILLSANAAPATADNGINPGVDLTGGYRDKIVEAAQKALASASLYQYRQVRPMAASLFSPAAYNTTDCSAFATLTYKDAGAPDPNGPSYNYNGYGNSGSLYAYGTPTDTPLPGDLVFWGPNGSAHVAVYVGGYGGVEAPGQIIEFGSTPIIQSTVQAETIVQRDREGQPFAGYRTYAFLNEPIPKATPVPNVNLRSIPVTPVNPVKGGG